MGEPDLTPQAALRLAGFGNRADGKLSSLADSRMCQPPQWVKG
jgi:hypothetical protein